MSRMRRRQRVRNQAGEAAEALEEPPADMEIHVWSKGNRRGGQPGGREGSRSRFHPRCGRFRSAGRRGPRSRACVPSATRRCGLRPGCLGELAFLPCHRRRRLRPAGSAQRGGDAGFQGSWRRHPQSPPQYHRRPRTAAPGPAPRRPARCASARSPGAPHPSHQRGLGEFMGRDAAAAPRPGVAGGDHEGRAGRHGCGEQDGATRVGSRTGATRVRRLGGLGIVVAGGRGDAG